MKHDEQKQLSLKDGFDSFSSVTVIQTPQAKLRVAKIPLKSNRLTVQREECDKMAHLEREACHYVLATNLMKFKIKIPARNVTSL